MIAQHTATALRLLLAGFLVLPPGAGFYPASAQSLSQSMRDQQRREAQQTKEAERQAKLPHPVSAAYQGSLAPASNIQSLISGKTLYLQTPFVQNGQLQKVQVAPIYFAPSGQAYSTNWAGRPWQASGNSICFPSDKMPSCMTAFSDSTGQAFLRSQDNLLVQVGKISSGDQDNVKGAYQKAQEQKQASDAAGMAILGMFLIAAMTSGGGSSGGSSQRDYTYYQRGGSSGGSSSGGSSYTPPIGGERGLYGSSHGVQ